MAEKKAQMGDFIGFSFNGIHSSELGLVRVSDGNRYEKNLFPAISDKTVQVPGRDGFYYFGSSYNTREMTVKVAFDNLEENEFRRMMELFKDKKPHFLWFDELPYKEYLVKIKSPPNFKYLCFDEKRLINEDGPWSEENLRDARIYKGEGTIIFVCYSPYARARVKALNDPVDKVIVKHDSNWPDWFDNYFLDGDNQIINYQDDQGTPHEFPPNGHPYRDGDVVKNGQGVRNLYDTGYLELAGKNGYWAIDEDEIKKELNKEKDVFGLPLPVNILTSHGESNDFKERGFLFILILYYFEKINFNSTNQEIKTLIYNYPGTIVGNMIGDALNSSINYFSGFYYDGSAALSLMIEDAKDYLKKLDQVDSFGIYNLQFLTNIQSVSNDNGIKIFYSLLYYILNDLKNIKTNSYEKIRNFIFNHCTLWAQNQLDPKRNFNKHEIMIKIDKVLENLPIRFFQSEDAVIPLYEAYNREEWRLSSNLPIDRYTIEESSNSLTIKNCGDIDMNTKILFSFNNSETTASEITINLKDSEDNIVKYIKIDINDLKKEIGRRGIDSSKYPYSFFFLDSQTKLLRAYDNATTDEVSDNSGQNFLYEEGHWDQNRETKDVFNNCITKGDFFKIPADNLEYKIEIETPSSEGIFDFELKDVEYTYLYY